MFKKVGLIFLVLLLAFSPVTVLAETVDNGNEENTESEDTANAVEEQSEQEATSISEGSDSENESNEANENSEAEDPNGSEAQDESGVEEQEDLAPAEDGESAVDVDSEEEGTDVQASTSEATTDEDAPVQDEPTEAEEESEVELLVNEEEEETEEEAYQSPLDDGDACALGKNTDGTVSGNVNLNDAGYYELALTATVYNCYSTVDDDGHIGFRLPDGVELIDELAPEGVEVRDGIVYVSYPDIESHEDVTKTFIIPVNGQATGEATVSGAGRYYYAPATDNYGWTDRFSEVAIDFSEVTEVPSLPELELADVLSSTISGSVTGFDSENGAYNLELSVDLINNADQAIEEETDLYVGFVVPEGLQVNYNDQNVIGLDIDNNPGDIEEILIHVPNEGTIASGETVSRTVVVPVLGMVAENASDSSISLYRGGGFMYESLGQLEGNASVDFSVMNEAWSFDAESQIVKDFPGLEEGQFGLQFAFSAQNLTLENVDQVSIEFIVPDVIDIHEPDSYSQGTIPDALEDFLNIGGGLGEDLDITWNGNSATINLDILEGTSGYQGYFSAFGESTESIEQLEGLQVVVTLYQNGNEVAEELMVPFEIVSHEGNDDESSEDPIEEPEDPVDNGDNQEGSEDEGDGQPSEEENQDNNQNENEQVDENPADNQDGSENDEDEQQVDIIPVDDQEDEANDRQGNVVEKTNSNDNDSNGEKTSTTIGSEGSRLPDTATNMYNSLLVGMILTLTGATILYIRKRKTA